MTRDGLGVLAVVRFLFVAVAIGLPTAAIGAQAGAARWRTTCPPLDALESGGAGAPYPWCPNAANVAAAETRCPTSDEIVVVIDNDNASAEVRSTASPAPSSPKATDWRSIVTDLMQLPEVPCGAGSNPLSKLPGACGSIQSQQLRSCRAGNRIFPAGLAGEGASTPAVEAIGWVGRLLTDRGTPRRGVVLLAFDGVVDGDYDKAPPPVAFGEAVADIVTKGLAVHVVASPRDYRYLYVIARPEYAAFAGHLAARFRERWARSTKDVAALSLSERGYTQPGRRAAVAKPQVKRVAVPGGNWDGSMPPLYTTKGESRRSWRIEVSDWLTQRDPKGAAFSLMWEASAEAWGVLTPFGTLLPPPALVVNRDLEQADPSRSPWSRAAGMQVDTLNNCPAPKDAKNPPDQRNYSTPLFQSLLVRALPPAANAGHQLSGRADLQIFRGATLDWLPTWSQQFKGTPTSKRPEGPFQFERIGWVNMLPKTHGPLVSAALVAPAPTEDPCLTTIVGRVRNSFLWQSSDSTADKLAGELPRECAAEPWATLLAAFKGTGSRRFHPTRSGPFGSYDARVAIETMLQAALTVSRVTVRKAASEPGAQPCVLQTFRVIFQPEFKNDPAWTRGER